MTSTSISTKNQAQALNFKKGRSEIERKFLLRTSPQEIIRALVATKPPVDILSVQKFLYETIYIATGNPEFRLRRITRLEPHQTEQRYKATVKVGQGLARDEYPIRLRHGEAI